jgi:hypothetical protein
MCVTLAPTPNDASVSSSRSSGATRRRLAPAADRRARDPASGRYVSRRRTAARTRRPLAAAPALGLLPRPRRLGPRLRILVLGRLPVVLELVVFYVLVVFVVIFVVVIFVASSSSARASSCVMKVRASSGAIGASASEVPGRLNFGSSAGSANASRSVAFPVRGFAAGEHSGHEGAGARERHDRKADRALNRERP